MAERMGTGCCWGCAGLVYAGTEPSVRRQYDDDDGDDDDDDDAG
jgi:hypothetical protein